MLLHLLMVCFFMLMSGIPLYGWTAFCLSVYQLMDICIVSNVLSPVNNAAEHLENVLDRWFHFSG